MICRLCPRNCGVDRDKTFGTCRSGSEMRVAKTMLHFWEEPPISGTRGSGAVFFAGCALRCCYCQNFFISQGENAGAETSPRELADIFKKLVDEGAHNINLVTPTHYTDGILKALDIYRPPVPVVWNTSSYETAENVERIKDYADIYLADIKYYSRELSAAYSSAPDYFERASEAVLQMRKNKPRDVFDGEGMMKEGLIIRHLVLPNARDDSKKIFGFIAGSLGTSTVVSLMNQYTPCYKAECHPILKNRVKPLEYKSVVAHVSALGFENGYIQDADSQTLDYTPDFSVNF